MTSENKKVYIGDAVYADFDGFAIILTTEDGISATNRIVLEPREWAKLRTYADELMAALKAFHESLKTTTESATQLGLAAVEALKEEEKRSEPRLLCVNPSCVDGLAPRKTGPDEGDVDMEPCPVCDGHR